LQRRKIARDRGGVALAPTRMIEDRTMQTAEAQCDSEQDERSDRKPPNPAV